MWSRPDMTARQMFIAAEEREDELGELLDREREPTDEEITAAAESMFAMVDSYERVFMAPRPRRGWFGIKATTIPIREQF